MKIVEEVGELIGSFAKEKFHGKRNNHKEELGDIFWYIANIEHFLDAEDDYNEYRERGKLNSSLLKLVDRASKLFSTHNERQISIYYLTEIKSITNNICHLLNFELESVLMENIEKISIRHGQTYNPDYYKR